MHGKTIAWAASLAATMAIGGCGAMEIGGPIDPHVVYPDLGPGSVRQEPLGFLSVRPVQEPLEGGQGPSSSVPPGYKVYDDRGVFVRRSAWGEITLPEGRYLVQLERPSRGPQGFWVQVERGKLSDVDLSRGSEAPSPTAPVE